MKNQNYNSANQMIQHNSLMWIKRSNYSQKIVPSISCIHHVDLNWVKIKGYKQNNNPAEQVQMFMTVYQEIELLKAQRKFYSAAMAAMMFSIFILSSAF